MKITTKQILVGILTLLLTACGGDSNISGGSKNPRVKEAKSVNEDGEVLSLVQTKYIKHSTGKKLASKITMIGSMHATRDGLDSTEVSLTKANKTQKAIINMNYNKDGRTSKWSQKSYTINEKGDEELTSERSMFWTYDVDKKTAYGRDSASDDAKTNGSGYDIVFMDSDFFRIKEKYKVKNGKRRLISQFSYKQEGTAETQIRRASDGRITREDIVEKVTDKIWAFKKRIFIGGRKRITIAYEHDDEVGTSVPSASAPGLLMGSGTSNLMFPFLFGRYAVSTSDSTGCTSDNEYNSNKLLIKSISTCERKGKLQIITTFLKYD